MPKEKSTPETQLPHPSALVGHDLAGCKIIKWNRVVVIANTLYLLDSTLAHALHEAKVGSSLDLYEGVVETLVLTKDGKHGYDLMRNIGRVSLADEEALRKELVRKAKEKLSSLERNLLGIK